MRTELDRTLSQLPRRAAVLLAIRSTERRILSFDSAALNDPSIVNAISVATDFVKGPDAWCPSFNHPGALRALRGTQLALFSLVVVALFLPKFAFGIIPALLSAGVVAMLFLPLGTVGLQYSFSGLGPPTVLSGIGCTVAMIAHEQLKETTDASIYSFLGIPLVFLCLVAAWNFGNVALRSIGDRRAFSAAGELFADGNSNRFVRQLASLMDNRSASFAGGSLRAGMASLFGGAAISVSIPKVRFGEPYWATWVLLIVALVILGSTVPAAMESTREFDRALRSGWKRLPHAEGSFRACAARLALLAGVGGYEKGLVSDPFHHLLRECVEADPDPHQLEKDVNRLVELRPGPPGSLGRAMSPDELWPS